MTDFREGLQRTFQSAIDGRNETEKENHRLLLRTCLQFFGSNFDAEVHDRLKINMSQSKEYLDRYARMLWAVTKHELGTRAKFVAPCSSTLDRSKGQSCTNPCMLCTCARPLIHRAI